MTELVEKLTEKVDVLSGENERLKEENAILKKALFGQKSERIVSSDAQLEFDLGDSANEPPPASPEGSKSRKSRKGKSLSRFEIPEDLPCEEIILDVPEKDRICQETGKAMELFKYEETRKLAYKPGSYFVKKFLRPVYKSPSANEFTVAPLPDFPIEKCRADVTVLANILVQKFADHLPLYRIEEILKRSSINIQRQTLCGWVLKLGEVLMPLYDLMMQKVLKGDRVFTDATGLNYLVKGKGTQKGYIWAYCGGDRQSNSKSPPYLVYQFSPDGKHTHPEKVLKQFSGLLISDAHRAYENASLRNDVQWQVCWAHARRKFVEAQSGSPIVKDEIIELFKQIFLKERTAWEMTAEKRLCFRQEQIKPHVDRVFEIVKYQREQVLLPKNKFSEAVNYMYSREKHFRTFLDNPQATVDNNLSERTIKPLVIGRKNWLFLGNKDSGKSTAAILTLVQTCRHLKIDPYKYLVDVLEKIMGYNSQKIHELLPDKWAKRQDS
jgi:transposase